MLAGFDWEEVTSGNGPKGAYERAAPKRRELILQLHRDTSCIGLSEYSPEYDIGYWGRVAGLSRPGPAGWLVEFRKGWDAAEAELSPEPILSRMDDPSVDP